MAPHILRRDFLNGALLAAGGAAMASFSPLQAFAGPRAADLADGLDPRLARGGNLPSAFNVGHWLRDRRLKRVSAASLELAEGVDTFSGSYPILPDAGRYDAIIVGSGISGFSAAFFLSQRAPKAKILILDANERLGGNAGRDYGPPLPTLSSTGSAYAVEPYADFLEEIYKGIGLEWERHVIPDPVRCYLFDENTPHVKPKTRGWVKDPYGAGSKSLPYPEPVLADLEKAKRELMAWYDREGGPTDPADRASVEFDRLSQISLEDYFSEELKLHPAVTDFFGRYTCDALTGTPAQINAHAAISFLGAEYHRMFTFPGGNSGLVRLILRALIPEAIRGKGVDGWAAAVPAEKALDAARSRVRLRLDAPVLRAETSEKEASVVYFHKGTFHRATAKTVILAGQSHTSRHLVDDLVGDDVRKAFTEITMAPAITANVALRSAKPLVEQGLGYNQYWWGGKLWADFTVADWMGPKRNDPRRPTVLTFYAGNDLPPEGMAGERGKLLASPFSEYEETLKEALQHVLGPAGFEFERDVSAIFVYRWGHAMAFPKVGYTFGPPKQGADGKWIRTPAPRHLCKAPIGRISFAGSDSEGNSSVECAIAAGLRAATESLGRL
jgi:spermidine dehydrogenase